MLRILKKHDFPFYMTSKTEKNCLLPGRSRSFRGYPGSIYSVNDLNVLSSGLAVIEVTIGNSNANPWKYVKHHGVVLEGIRPKGPTGWLPMARVFSKWNCGTYYNQWMVVITRNSSLTSGGQLSGHVHSEGMTQVLRNQSYLPNYSTPYFKDIFNMSGALTNVKKFGDWFTYNTESRTRAASTTWSP